MSSDELHELCLGMAGAAETFPFSPGVSVFKVGGKIFAITTLDSEPLEVSLKCEPELATELRSAYEAVVPGYHLNKRHWITVTVNGDLPDDALRGLIEDSHGLVSR